MRDTEYQTIGALDDSFHILNDPITALSTSTSQTLIQNMKFTQSCYDFIFVAKYVEQQRFDTHSDFPHMLDDPITPLAPSTLPSTINLHSKIQN